MHQKAFSQKAKACYLAYLDIKDAWVRYSFWMFLAWVEIKIRYRGSKLGPFWISLSMAIFVSALGVIFSQIFHQSPKEYIPFLTCGFLVWNFIASTTIESCETFAVSRQHILQIKLPYLVYILKTIWRNVIVFFHNVVVYIAVMIYFHVSINWNLLWFFPAFLILLLNLMWFELLVSLASARFHDVRNIVASLVQVVFFVTPVTWMPKLVAAHSLILIWNPVAHFLNLLREPLLGIAPSLNQWLFCIVLTLFGWLITFPIFAYSRRYISFWV